METANKNKNYHFIAIGGVGQSALAKILAIKGFNVSGSDIVESKYTKALQELGVKISIGQKKENIKENQIVVLSSAIKEDNPEFIEAKRLNLPLLHRSDVLKLISEQYETFIGFSGTHGKTTTTSLCSYILEKINAHPAYASGGIISGLDTNANAYPDSKIFVAELDESDGTIVKYKPDYIVINNLEPDHFDFYKNGEKDLLNQFHKFFENLKPTSKIFINIDDEGNKHFLNSINSKNLITYSIKDNSADYFASDIELNPTYNSYKLYYKGELKGEIKTGLLGVHNVINSLSVIAVLMELGFNSDEIKKPLSEFQGAKRRFETVFSNSDIKIIDDYAHHPTEIKATLSSAKKQAENKRIVAIFQPHRYTRLKALWDEFLTSFDLADILFVVETFSAGDKFDPEFNSEKFSETIKHKCVKYIKGSMNEAAEEISKYIKKDDFILTIGAGDVTKIGHLLGGIYETGK